LTVAESRISGTGVCPARASTLTAARRLGGYSGKFVIIAIIRLVLTTPAVREPQHIDLSHSHSWAENNEQQDARADRDQGYQPSWFRRPTRRLHGNGERHQLEWAFFPACTGTVEPLTYETRVATRRCGRPLSPSELACYASHFKIWEWLAVSDYDQAIIFEDDVLVAWPVIEQIAAHRFAGHGVNLLRPQE
jgi:hypothetical protein